MTSAIDVMDAVAGALAPVGGRFPTDADDRISRPGTMAAQPGQYPRFTLRFMGETKQSVGRNSIGFTTTVTIRIEGQVSETASVLDDVNRSQIEGQVAALKMQLERAIINSAPLFGIVQQLASVTTQYGYEAQDTQLGGFQSDYAFEIFETADDFFQFTEDDLEEVVAVDPNHPGVGFTEALT